MVPPSVAARLDRLPPSRYLRNLVLRIAAGGFFEFYDLFMTGYIAVGLLQSKIFVSTTENFWDIHGFASFVGAGFAGMFLGTLLFGWLSDRYGRRATFTYSLLMYSAATFVMALMSTPAALDLWRFISGIGIGVQIVSISSYVTELSPKDSRGRYIAMTLFVCFCAVPCVAGISLLLIGHSFWGLEGWRYVAMIGASGALFVWFLRAGLPESPRWLDARGRRLAAERVVSEIENRVRAEIGRELPAPAQDDNQTAPQHGAWAEIWGRVYLRRTVMLTVFNALQSIGFYGFAAWVPVLLISEGIEVPKSLLYVALIATVNPIGPLIAMRFADALQRKWQIVALALIVAIGGLVWAQQRTAPGIVLLGAVITLANNWFSAALHTYQTELYPTRIRAQAVGFVYSWSRFTSIFVGFFIAAALRAYGSTGAFAIIATAMLVVALVVGAFGPNSNRLPLEFLSK